MSRLKREQNPVRLQLNLIVALKAKGAPQGVFGRLSLSLAVAVGHVGYATLGFPTREQRLDLLHFGSAFRQLVL